MESAAQASHRGLHNSINIRGYKLFVYIDVFVSFSIYMSRYFYLHNKEKLKLIYNEKQTYKAVYINNLFLLFSATTLGNKQTYFYDGKMGYHFILVCFANIKDGKCRLNYAPF